MESILLPFNDPTVLIDSSVLFSAALSPKGSADDLIQAGIRGEVKLAISSFLLAETERNLAAKASSGFAGFQAFRDSGILRVVEPS